jgi:hypothetical protein
MRWLRVQARAQGGADSGVDEDLTYSGRFGSKSLGDGATVVDASSDSEWQHLDRGEVVSEDEGWDLAVNRYFIDTNGGVDGSGGVELAALEGQAFADVRTAPSEGFALDQPDGDGDTNTMPDNAFDNGPQASFDYDEKFHWLRPHDTTYVVHSTDDAVLQGTGRRVLRQGRQSRAAALRLGADRPAVG